MDEKKKISFRMSAGARDSFDEILKFLTERSINAAEMFLRKFAEFEKTVVEFPEIFPKYDDTIENYNFRKAILSNLFIVLYKVEDDEIIVQAVVDCRKDNAWLRNEKNIFHEELDSLMIAYYNLDHPSLSCSIN